MEYLTPKVEENNNIQLPTLPQGVTFDFKYGFLQMIESNQFNEASHEDPMVHLRRFLRLCDTIRQPNICKKYVRLHVFPFSANGKAWDRLSVFSENIITNWTRCSSAFLKRYLSVMKTDKLQRHIGNFTQNEQENFLEAWERFHELLRSFPHHGFN